jgi:hypothetical protein
VCKVGATEVNTILKCVILSSYLSRLERRKLTSIRILVINTTQECDALMTFNYTQAQAHVPIIEIE